MSSRKPASASPVSWVRDLLKRPAKQDLRGGRKQAPVGDPEQRQGSSGSSAGEALRRGHDDLRALLRRHAETRQLMRHLAFVERTISRFGSRALQREIPVPVLRKGIEQLDLLVRGAPTEGLVYLRARLVEAVNARSAAVAFDSDTDTGPGSLEVSEGSQSLFDELERSWTGQMPMDPPPR